MQDALILYMYTFSVFYARFRDHTCASLSECTRRRTRGGGSGGWYTPWLDWLHCRWHETVCMPQSLFKCFTKVVFSNFLLFVSLNRRHESIITKLYTGIQCYSCGMRFTASQTDIYADHLDWHYRQNRSEKDISRKITHRRWYYSLTVSPKCILFIFAIKAFIF